MLPQEIIRVKRDGGALSAADIAEFVGGVAARTVSEAQVAAFCMAVVLRKMNAEERVALTSAIAGSGSRLSWEGLPGPVLDKHSTGGVGDKPSLILAPVVAACGGFVPMLAGRSLGHTGGTLDKMDAIPGYVSRPAIPLLKRTVRAAGCAIIGATDELAPADRIMYAVRDVTATVESLDLMTASIVAKKLVAGLTGLVMDVKSGTGAFLRAPGEAQALARSIVSVSAGAGLPAVALMTDMNQVLGRSAGNALEVAEAAAFLRGEVQDERLYEVTAVLSAELLVLGGLAKDAASAREKVRAALDSGRAAERFARMVAELGGPKDFMDAPAKHLKPAPVVRPFTPARRGVVSGMDVFQVGLGLIRLGAGRRMASDAIDHAVGLTETIRIGEEAGPGARPLAVIHARDEAGWRRMAATLESAVTLGGPVPEDIIVKERIAP